MDIDKKSERIESFQDLNVQEKGEQAETQHWLQTAHSCGYISGKVYEDLMQSYKEIGGMLGKMMNEPGKWCSRFSK